MVCLLLLGAPGLRGQTAEEIMSRVAANQDRAQSMRSAFVYHQNLMIRFNRSGGRLAREEVRDYTVTPGATGVKKELTHFAGKYEKKGKVVEFSDLEFEHKGLDIDRDVARDLAEEWTNDSKSRDGIGADLFPLTAQEQKKYKFRLAGTEDYRGASVFRVLFEPERKKGEDDPCWAGEALVEAAEFQPVVVSTHFSCGIPMLVKTLLGTNFKHLGFKVTYKKFDEGLWFPVTYGGELKVRAVFMYGRTISIGLVNSDFKRAEVRSKVQFEDTVAKP